MHVDIKKHLDGLIRKDKIRTRHQSSLDADTFERMRSAEAAEVLAGAEAEAEAAAVLRSMTEAQEEMEGGTEGEPASGESAA